MLISMYEACGDSKRLCENNSSEVHVPFCLAFNDLKWQLMAIVASNGHCCMPMQTSRQIKHLGWSFCMVSLGGSCLQAKHIVAIKQGADL